MAIAKDPWVKEKLKEIARAKDRIQLHEGDTKNLLYSLHEVYCNGQRGVTTIGEFNSIPGSSLDNAQPSVLGLKIIRLERLGQLLLFMPSHIFIRQLRIISNCSEWGLLMNLQSSLTLWGIRWTQDIPMST